MAETVTFNVALKDSASKGLRDVKSELKATAAATADVAKESDEKNFGYGKVGSSVGALGKALDSAAGKSRTLAAANSAGSRTMKALQQGAGLFKSELSKAIREQGEFTGKLSVMGVAAEAAKKRTLRAFSDLRSGVNSAVSKIKPSFSGVVEGAKGAARKAGGALKSGMTAIGTGAMAAAGAALGVSLTKGFSRLTKIDEARAKLRGLGNDTKAIDVIMKNATASVKGTAFGLDSAATTAAGAVAAGIKPGAELEAVLKTVSNAASASGSDMGEMGNIFNKVAATGKAQTDSMNMLADRGLPIWTSLSRVTGVAREDLAKYVASGNVDFATFAAAAKAASGTVAKEMGMTLPGTVQNLMAAFGRLGATLLAPFAASAPKLITAATGVIDKVNAAVQPFMQTLGDKLAPIVSKVADTITKLTEGGMGGFASSLQSLSPVLGAIGGLLVAFGSKGLGQLASQLPLVGGLLSKLPFALNPVVGIIAGLTAVSPELQGALMTVAKLLGGTLMSVITQLTPLVGELVGVIAGVLKSALSALVPAIMSVVKALLPMVGMILQAGMSIVRALMPAVSSILTALGPVFDVIGTLVTALSPVIQVVGVLVGALAKVIAAVLVPVIKVAAAILTWAVSAIAVGLKWLFSVFGGVWNGIVTVVRAVVGWFQTAVVPVFTAVWNGIATAAQWAYTNVLQPIFTGLKIAFLVVATAFGLYWNFVLKPVFTGIATVALWLWNSVLMPVFGWMKQGWGLLAQAFSLMWSTLLHPVFSAVGSTVRWLWANVAQPTFAALRYGFSLMAIGLQVVYNTMIAPVLRAVGFTVRWLKDTVWNPVLGGIKSAWSTMASGLRTVKTTIIDPVFSAIKTAVHSVRTAFERAKDGIGSAWSQLKEKTAAPVRFIVNTVYNDKIRGVWNGIADKVGMGNLKLPEAKFAKGGVMPGYTPGRDVHHFTSPTGGRLSLSGGEAIMRPEFTAALGTVGVNQINAAARQGGVRGVQSYLKYGGEAQAQFADGGVFGAGQNGGATNAGVARAQAWAKAQVGKPYTWGGVGPGGYDCSGFMSAITNVLTNRSPYHRLFATGSFGPKKGAGGFVPGITGSAFSIGVSPNTGSGIGHTAGTLGGMNVESYGSHGPATGGGARGADDKLFPWKFHLPVAGGQFVSGGGGGGGQPLFNINPLQKLKNLFGNLGAGSWGDMLAAGGKKLVGGMVSKVMPFQGGVQAAGAEVARWVGGAKAMATRIKGLAWGAANGMSPSDIAAMDYIIQHESGWNNNSTGGTSSATGLPQFLTMQCTEQGFAAPLSQYSMEFQLAAMRKYVMGRFHSWGAALDFWKSHKWYADGGVIPSNVGVYDNGGPLPHGAFGVNTSGSSEYVLTNEQSGLLSSGLRNMNASGAGGATLTIPKVEVTIAGDVYGVEDLEDKMEKVAEQMIESVFREWEERR